MSYTAYQRIVLAFAVVLIGSITLMLDAQQFDRKNVAGDQFILRCATQEVAEVAERYDLEIVHKVNEGSRSVALVRSASGIDSDALVHLLLEDGAVDGFEPALVAALPEQSEPTELGGSEGDLSLDLLSQGTFSSPCIDEEFASPVWSGYATQWAAERLNLHQAQLVNHDCGQTVLAVIDTGVDPEHELLKGSLVPGFDFILNQAGFASDWSNLEQ